jgi:hypothetical protein
MKSGVPAFGACMFTFLISSWGIIFTVTFVSSNFGLMSALWCLLYLI